ncbi:MAG: NAD(P)-dependent oxidoreductase [Deltaproteobacteria bacterium HGW-Deltaproteobacteria-21]|nr:MAG: NAD(P)-dependent oxidoreductase [Deltaproteobacteria bacterium HGW-Deltaproteobacteria-21]
MSTVGLMGFGTMGSVAAEKIVKAGHTLLVFEPDAGARKRAESLGAGLAVAPSEAADGADLVLMFLPGPKQVKSCVTGSGGILEGARPGLAIVDMSTVDPGTTMSMSEAARPRNVGYLDAPVLGRPSSVGNWALPVGGEPEILEKCRPVLGLLAAKIFHIGPTGSGNRVKLLNQLMFGAINAMTAEMMAVASKMGISPGVVYETISASQAATVSGLFKELGRRVSAEDYADPTFTVDLLVKDVRLAVQMAKESGAPPILGRSVELINEMAQAQGLGGQDTSMMWKSFTGVWGGGKGKP